MSADFPSDLKYTKDHEWVSYDSDSGLATVGITTFAAEQLGDVVSVDLPSPGDRFSAGEVFGTVESVKAVSDLFSPVSGTVRDVNSTLTDSPEYVNEDGYGEGWMVRIALDDPGELDTLLDAEAYTQLLAEDE